MIPMSSYETILRPSRLRCSAVFCWKTEEDMVVVVMMMMIVLLLLTSCVERVVFVAQDAMSLLLELE